MGKYIKANRKVAEHLDLVGKRYRTLDDCFILWQNDLARFGPPAYMRDICKRIGALVLEPKEAKQEQDGAVLRPLPEAVDERFVIDSEAKEESLTQTEEEHEPGVSEQND